MFAKRAQRTLAARALAVYNYAIVFYLSLPN